MSLQVTRRDMLILGVFTALLVIGTWRVIARITAVPEETGPDLSRAAQVASAPARATPGTGRSRPGGAYLQTALKVGQVPERYRVIVERNLFEPLVKARSKPSPAGEVPEVPAVTVPQPTQRQAENVNSEPTENVMPPMGNSGRSEPAPPPKPPLVVTGLIDWGDGYRVVLEHTEKNQTRVVRLGDDAFGYRVVEVDTTGRKVVVERTEPSASGSAAASRSDLKLGDKVVIQPEKKADAPSTGAGDSGGGANQPSGTPPPMGPSGGWRFDPGQLTPEQRQRWEEFRRRRRGSSNGFGG